MEGMLNYFVPEDGDSSDHLNVVPLPRVDQLRLQHVKKCFPLPGDFHFRFKTAFEGTYVWLDVVNDADAVPDYNGLVISKISRVQRASATPAAAKQPAAAKPQPVKAPDLIETSLPPTPSAKREEQPAPAKAFNDDLVGLLADPVPTTSPNTSAPPTPTPAAAPVPQDPFNLFMGSSGGGGGAPAMRPGSAPMNASRGPNQGNPAGYGGAPAFNPMGSGGPGSMGSGGPGSMGSGGPGSMGSGGPGSMGPRPSGNMNISQMHMGMSQPPQQQQQQQQQNSFQGLQWQGMGQPSQAPPPRNPMQPNSRQW